MSDFTDWCGDTGLDGLWGVFGSAGFVEGNETDLNLIRRWDGGAEARYEGFTLSSVCDHSPEGVYTRDDVYRNTSDHVQSVQRCVSRFLLPGGEYEVYTQVNYWQHESEGRWIPLISKAAVWNRGIRACEGGTPMLALWNIQTRRGIVFHVFSSCAWKITASVESKAGTETAVVVEAGLTDRGVNLTVEAGETLHLPKVLWYEFDDRLSMGSEKLHAWFQRCWPRRRMPVIFNTWMMMFDWLEPDSLCRHAKLAADAGAEYFVIDAGWFGGEGRWSENIGEWTENTKGAIRGCMRRVADYVRSLGMHFGLWLEPERALKGVTNLRDHPEWFFSNGKEYFSDFGNDGLRTHMTKTVLDLVNRYGVEFIKFDFNAGISYDPTGSGFLRWNQGHERFLNDIRASHPDIYLECCASGGERMDLYDLTLYDSVWPSDNHSVYDQVSILKETSWRLPMCCMERWPIFKDAGETINYDTGGTSHQLVACDDCSWNTVRGVRKSWLKSFFAGGPMGLSLDFETMEPETFAFVQKTVESFKQEREFWMTAVSRVLVDTPQILAIQYASTDASILRITVFNWSHRQKSLRLYPVCDGNSVYNVNGISITGKSLLRDGVEIPMPESFAGEVIVLEAVE